MIVPMKKVSLVVLDRERKEALRTLRKLGVVHLEQIEGRGDTLSELRRLYADMESVHVTLSQIKLPKDADVSSHVSLAREQAVEKTKTVLGFLEEKKTIGEQIQKNVRELERFEKWGDVDPADFAYLREKGVFISMYETPAAKYAGVSETADTVKVNADKNDVRFLLLTSDGQRPDGLSADAFAVTMPEKPTAAMREEIADAERRLGAIDEELKKIAVFRDGLTENLVRLGKEVEFENVYSGMAADTEGAHALAWLTGYVPVSDTERVRRTAAEEKWAFIADDPSDEDEVPTKLKNNRFVSLIDPVMNFLGTVPGYREYDISNWFLLFFSVFFGMIFGDAGYGFLLVLVALGAIIGAAVKKRTAQPAMYLLFLLGFATVVWGTLTCSWFGIPVESLPPFFRSISLWQFSNANPASAVNVQIFCFVLALVQLSIAHLKGVVRNIRSPKMLGDLGSLFQLWGMFFVVLNMVVRLDSFMGIPTMGTATFILIGGGFALSFVFSNYEGSIIGSIKESLINIVSVLLGVVNIFSDIVSYIRLWAVGLAGASIAATVNAMAGPALGGFLLFAGILLLVFGHGLNMILNVLSVIVHGVRLNTLEFTSHLGMSWSGFKYEPFSETVRK